MDTEQNYCLRSPFKELHSSQRIVSNTNTINSSEEQYFDPEDWSIEDFEIGCPIGKGGFGKVYLARTKNEHFVCAIKLIEKKKILKDAHLVGREIEIQQALNHSNILKLYGYFWDSKFIYLITEYAPDGNLFHKMNSQVYLFSLT